MNMNAKEFRMQIRGEQYRLAPASCRTLRVWKRSAGASWVLLGTIYGPASAARSALVDAICDLIPGGV